MRHTNYVSSFLGNSYMNLFLYKETHFFAFIQFSSLFAQLCYLVAHPVGNSVTFVRCCLRRRKHSRNSAKWPTARPCAYMGAKSQRAIRRASSLILVGIKRPRTLSRKRARGQRGREKDGSNSCRRAILRLRGLLRQWDALCGLDAQ